MGTEKMNRSKKSHSLKFLSLFIVLVISSADILQAQQSQLFRLAEGFVRIAEPGQLSDTLNVWGDVNAPGRYIVPRGTTVHEILSYSRGAVQSRQPGQNIDWNKLRMEVSISTFDPDTGRETVRNFEYRYNEPYPEELRSIRLRNDDIVAVEMKRSPAFIDWLRVFSTVVSATATTIIVIDRLSD